MTNDSLPTISMNDMDNVTGGARSVSRARGLYGFGYGSGGMLQWQMMQQQLLAAQQAAQDKSSRDAMMVAAIAMAHRNA